jgi:hypothetical protein
MSHHKHESDLHNLKKNHHNNHKSDTQINTKTETLESQNSKILPSDKVKIEPKDSPTNISKLPTNLIKPIVGVLCLVSVIGLGFLAFSKFQPNIKETVVVDASIYSEYNKYLTDFTPLFENVSKKKFANQEIIYNKAIESSNYADKEIEIASKKSLQTPNNAETKDLVDLLNTRKSKADNLSKFAKKFQESTTCALPLLNKIEETKKSLAKITKVKPTDEESGIKVLRQTLPLQKTAYASVSEILSCPNTQDVAKVENVKKDIALVVADIDKAIKTTDAEQFKAVITGMGEKAKKIAKVDPYLFLPSQITPEFQNAYNEMVDLNKNIATKIETITQK